MNCSPCKNIFDAPYLRKIMSILCQTPKGVGRTLGKTIQVTLGIRANSRNGNEYARNCYVNEEISQYFTTGQSSTIQGC